MVRARSQIHPAQQFGGLGLRLRHACKLQRQHDVFERGEPGQKLKGLEYKTHGAPAQPGPAVLIQCREILTRKRDMPRTGKIKPCKQSNECGFA